VKFLLFKKSLFLKLLRLKILKETIQASKRNKILIIKSIGLDLTSIIGVYFNLTTSQKDNMSKIRSLKVTLVNFKMIIGRNLI
jgi:hypothetical protein